jgi:hypothetical protein
MGKKVSWFDTSEQQRVDWEALCPVNEFRVIRPDQVPTIVPFDLVRKADSVLLVASGSASGTVFYMANVNRVEAGVLAVDQQPFALAFVGSAPTVSGCLIHHGRWDDRTTNPPEAFWRALTASGLGNCTPFSELPGKHAGSISELRVTSHSRAFEISIGKLKQFVDANNANHLVAPDGGVEADREDPVDPVPRRG